MNLISYLLKMVELTMNGDVLKSMFNPIPIKTTYTLFDWLNERDMSLEKYLHYLKYVECAKSKDKSCANFECANNFRLLHKIEKTGNYDELKEMVVYHG